MPDRNQSPPGPGIIKNRGGRPRNDGTRADNAKTLAELGISKRMAALARLYASIPDDEFETAMDRREADIDKGGRVRPLRAYLPDRRANSRHERENRANVARIISTARLIAHANECDASPEAALLRHMAERTIELWSLHESAAHRTASACGGESGMMGTPTPTVSK
jgi:hypothetical protein